MYKRQSYTATITGINANPGWITVYEGSNCGNWVAEGSAPLTWTSTVAGTYYIHWGVDSTCATASGCHTTTLIGNAPVVSGCTDPIATNYDPLANVDDGSCTYVLGCTDSLATNYDPLATQDDGSCLYAACSVLAPTCYDFNTGVAPVPGCPNGFQTSALSGDGWRFSGNPGYNASTFVGNNRAQGTFAWIDFSSIDAGVVMQLDPIDVSALTTPTLSFQYFSDIGTYTSIVTPNIMHVEAYNGTSWDSVATYQEFNTGWILKTIDVSAHAVSGIVSLRLRGESGGDTWDYYNDLLIDDVCVAGAPVLGCTDPLACNYDSLANLNDGSCTYPGCTDPGANNYDPTAGCDDGSCVYSCTAAPYYENFDAGMGTFTTANTGTGSYPGWFMGTSTPSFGTGPQSGDVTGGSFMYIETSGLGGPYTLTSECLDITTLTAPALRFHYHMYGATMGTLDVSVNGTSVWTLSGDQGDQWFPVQVDLAAYATSDSIVIVFTGTRGSSFTGDMAIDAIEVDEMLVLASGCTNPLACNYDSTAVIDDGSCVFPGCTDPLALNYDPTACSDDGSCYFYCNNTSASVSYTHLTLPTKAHG